ncbi:MAG: hypothetical protein WBQ21_05490 [Solirubrobacteraceae bacterium]
MTEQDLYVVTVTDRLLPVLVGRAGCHYRSPPQDEQAARALIRLLLGTARVPTNTGPWEYPLPGGRRYVTLDAYGDLQ